VQVPFAHIADVHGEEKRIQHDDKAEYNKRNEWREKYFHYLPDLSLEMRVLSTKYKTMMFATQYMTCAANTKVMDMTSFGNPNAGIQVINANPKAINKQIPISANTELIFDRNMILFHQGKTIIH
jgi:hypothetical protein